MCTATANSIAVCTGIIILGVLFCIYSLREESLPSRSSQGKAWKRRSLNSIVWFTRAKMASLSWLVHSSRLRWAQIRLKGCGFRGLGVCILPFLSQPGSFLGCSVIYFVVDSFSLSLSLSNCPVVRSLSLGTREPWVDCEMRIGLCARFPVLHLQFLLARLLSPNLRFNLRIPI